MAAAQPRIQTEATRTMGHRAERDILFVRHRELAPTDRDWQAMLDDLGERLRPGGLYRILVRTDNAGPNSLQRNAINQLATSKRATLRVAVMSTSRLVRGIVTAFSWMGTLQIRSFGDADLAGAIAYLGLDDVSAMSAARMFSEIERDVG